MQLDEQVTSILDAHIVEIDREPTDLRHSLLAARCGGNSTVVCRIIGNAPAEPVHA